MALPTSQPVQPLPASLLGDASALSRQARSEIKALSGPRPGPFLRSAATSWLIIIALIASAVWVDHWAFTLPVLFLIATRQMALAYLMHEQSHYLGFKSRWGDLITNFLVAYPLLVVDVEKYAQVHISHHRHYFSDKDPDYHRKSGDEWAQPMPLRQLLANFLQDLVGLNVIRLIRGKKMQDKPYPRRMSIPAWVKPAYLLVVAALLTIFSAWDLFLLYWLLPLLTFFQIISRVGALTEHRYNLKEAALQDSTPLIIFPWWQRLLVPDLNFSYHIYHHYFPGVSFSKLPRVHEIFQREGLVKEENVYRGFGDYFRRAIIRRSEEGSSPTAAAETDGAP